MAINFAGGTKYLSISGTPPVTAPPFTVGCWFKAPDITSNSPLFYIGNSGSTSDFFAINAQGGLAGDPVSIRTHSGGALDQCNTSTSFSANTWHHACGVWTSTTSRTAYLDAGGAVTTTASKAPSGVNLMGIGATLDASPNYGEAIVAEVGLWNVALTAADVAMLAKGVSPLLVRPDALVAYWPLLRNSDPSVDRVGGYSMAWTGGPTEAEHPRIYYPTAQIFTFPPAAVGGGITGTLTKTQASDTISSAGTLAIEGTVTTSQAGDTVSAGGTLAIDGDVSLTQAGDTIVASGVFGTITTGELNATQAGDTISSAGTLALSGDLDLTQAGDTVTAAATLSITGEVSTTQEGDSLTSTGFGAGITGELSVTQEGDTVVAYQTTPGSGLSLGGGLVNDGFRRERQKKQRARLDDEEVIMAVIQEFMKIAA